MSSSSTIAGGTREQIVDVARNLIRTRSYLGFSFQDVADQVGIRKASLYHHFATKEALGIEVLNESIQGFRRWSTSKERKPDEVIDAYCRMLRNSLHAGDGVCPTGALAPGWGLIGDELRRAVRDLRNEHVNWLTKVFIGDKSFGGAKHSAAMARSAGFVFVVCQGALLSARITGRIEDFDDAVAHLKAFVPA